MSDPALLQLCAAAVVLCTLPFTILAQFSLTWSRRTLWLSIVVLTLVFCFAVLEFSVCEVPFATAVLLAATVVTAASLVLSAGLAISPLARVAVFVVVVSLSLTVPLTLATFDTESGALSRTLHVLDFAGALTIAVSASVAALVLASVGRPTRAPDHRTEKSAERGVLPAVIRTAAIVVGMAAVQVGSELVLDDASATLVMNQIVAAGAGALGWCGAAVLGARLDTVRVLDRGVLAGSVAVLSCSPWLALPAVIVIALGAGAMSFWVANKSAIAEHVSGRYVGAMLVPGALGVLAAGVVANPVGLLYSGHTNLLAAQLVGFGIAALGSLAGAWLIRLAAFAGRKSPMVGDAGLEPTTSSV